MDTWNTAQEWERDWWGNCVNSFFEEEKQLGTYAPRMGLIQSYTPKTSYNFDLDGISILDIGGGPVSLLLKCVDFSRAKVADPLEMPDWVLKRYELAGIEFDCVKGECVVESGWDEVWIYNVLEHTESPQQVIENARIAGGLIRIFEWIDTNPSNGHPQTLTENELNEWLNGHGKTEYIKRGNIKGKAYYGIFPT